MKLHCPLSGLVWNAEGFPSIHANRMWQQPHPIFSIPFSSLLSRAPDFFAGRLSPVETRLLYLSLLNSSGLIDWRVAAIPADSLISQTFESLLRTLSWMDTYEYDPVAKRRRGPNFPRFVISKDTASLTNIFHWLQAWADARGEYEAGSRREEIKAKQKRREEALTRLIANTGRDPQTYSKLLASWMADATEFPTFPVSVGGETVTLREFWIKTITNTKIYEIADKDLQEIEEHLIENLDHGSSYAVAALNLIRRKRKAISVSLGIGDLLEEDAILSGSGSPFTMIDPHSGVELDSTSKPAPAGDLIDPSIEPQREDFSSHTDFLRAKARWIVSRAPKKLVSGNNSHNL